jgi:hypothetical protein
MRGRKTALSIVLSDTERDHLQALCRATTTPIGLVRRAKAVLAVHDGNTIRAVTKIAGLTEPHVRKWVRRFIEKRIPGLKDAARPGRPPTFPPRGGSARDQDRL